MATKTKHIVRSRLSSHNTIPTQMFANKANARQAKKENKGFLEKFFNRTTNK